MPFRLPGFGHGSTGPDTDTDTSRRWLWLALLTGLLALVLAGSALTQRLAPPTGSAAADSIGPLPTPNRSQTITF